MGKKVPENRNSGVMPNRNRALNPPGPVCVAVKAMIGAAKERAVSTATGTARTTRGEAAALSKMMTATNSSDSNVARKAIHIRSPASRSVAPSGVLREAWYVLSHSILPMIGQADSNAAAIIACVTSSAGAM